MRKIALLMLLHLFAGILLAQSPKKYQSLLWEISGNGLEKKSYIYGTMHVSDRISYHLSDAFFEHLMAADIVATEIDFDLWKEMEYLYSGFNDWGYGSLYRLFLLHPISREDILWHFSIRNRSLMNMMFRTSDMMSDYQEETYLDMFIYQTARKFNKKATGLEDMKDLFSMASVLSDDEYDDELMDEKIAQARKLMKGKDYWEAISDFYREKDLDMLDSLSSLVMSEKYKEVILFQRNAKMVTSMQKLMAEGSLFAAVGAAHLPGTKGIIEMLRGLGYTVTPVFGDYTDVGKAEKKRIDEYFTDPPMKEFVTLDGVIKMYLPGKAMSNFSSLYCADITNGGFVSVKRSSLNDFLNTDGSSFNHLTLDSLFFENIPGDIQSKKFVKEKEFSYYDIQNTTKTGKAQRYRFYITPLELITVAMSGNGNYTKTYSDRFFDSIEIKLPDSRWTSFTPVKRTFTAAVPSGYVVYGEHDDMVVPEDLSLFAYDPSNKSDYFIIENTAKDFTQEVTEFELERIQKEFLFQYDGKDYKIIKKSKNTLEASAKIGSKNIWMKTIIHGNSYYLLGCVKCNEIQKNNLFNGFVLQKSIENKDYRLFVDENYGFQVELPYKSNEVVFLSNIKKPEKEFKDKENMFAIRSQSYSFRSADGLNISLSINPYHRYETVHSVDSVMFEIRRRYMKESEKKVEDLLENSDEIDEIEDFLLLISMLNEEYFSTSGIGSYYSNKKAGPLESVWNKLLNLNVDKDYEITGEKRQHIEDGDYHIYDLLVKEKSSVLAIRIRMYFKDGVKYTLRVGVPMDYSYDNEFVERVFASFVPSIKASDYSVFEPKGQVVISHLKDTCKKTQYSALQSLGYIDFKKLSVEEIAEIILLFEKTKYEAKDVELLIAKVSQAEIATAIEFLEKLYNKEGITASQKIAILRGLGSMKSTVAYKKILELMELNLPISSSFNDIPKLFSSFEKNLEYSSNLIPEIFEYFYIEEYKNPLLKFFRAYAESKYFQPKKFDSFRKVLLSNANVEFRRTQSWYNTRVAAKESVFGSAAATAVTTLNNYLHILYPFISEKEYETWFNKVKELDIAEIQLELLILQINNSILDTEFVEKLLEKPETRFVTRVLIAKRFPDYKFPKITEVQLAESAFVVLSQTNLSKITIELKDQKTISHNGHNIRFYFFVSNPIESSDSRFGKNNLQAVGFVLDDKGKIIPDAFCRTTIKRMDDDSKYEEYCIELMERCLYDSKNRVSYGKVNNNDYYFDFF